MMPNVEEKYFEPRRNDDEFRNEVIGLLQTGNGRFRFQKVNGEVKNPAKISETKKSIARLKTILGKKINP